MSDPQYRTFSYRLAQPVGLVARDVYDKMRPGSYLNLDNLESRSENSLSSRYGLAALSTDGTTNDPLGSPAQTLGRMKGLSAPYNYAVGGTVLYRKSTDGIGAYATVGSGLSGRRVSMYPYRPSGTSAPYMFFADGAKLLKDSGTAVQNWGIAPPTVPALIAPTISGFVDIELFDEANDTSFTLANVTGDAMLGRASAAFPAITINGPQVVLDTPLPGTTVSRTSGVTTATTASNHNYVTGMRIAAVVTAGDGSFSTSSSVITVTGLTTFTYPNAGPNSAGAGTQLTISALPSFQVGMSITTQDGGSSETVYITEVTTLGFVAAFTNTHIAGTVMTSNYLGASIAANTLATVSKRSPFNLQFANIQENPQDNLIQLYLLLSDPLAVKEVKILFDVGDGSFTQDYFYKSMVMSVAQSNVAGNVSGDIAQTGAVFQRAGGALEVRTLGGDDPSLLPTDLPLLQQMQPTALDPGANVWTLFQSRIGDFVAVGAAGNPGTDWPNVVAWRISIQTNPTQTTTFGIDDLAFIGGSDLDSFAGQPYDYRYTYYNINTGDESSPSQIMVATDITTFLTTSAARAFYPVPLSVQRQAIEVSLTASLDPQVTHFRIYRRGGTLTQGWYFVSQVPIGSTLFTDTIADSVILVNNLLNVNADPPVTTLLPAPVSAIFELLGFSALGPGLVNAFVVGGNVVPGQLVTIGSFPLQEQAYVQSVGSGTAVIYLQLQHAKAGTHNPGTPLTASTNPSTPMNLMAIAFDKAWLAGDPNNPHVLYYSTTFQPETFPVQNFLEIGTPDAPIMALIELNGLLFVFTTKRVYEILGAGSAVPTVIPTGVKHGLAAQFAWCASESRIYYLSYDGIYVFSGGASNYLSEPVEWIWTGKNLGPIPALNSTRISNVFMAYANREVFVAYTDQSSVTHRLIYHEIYKRWRNDDYLSGNITAQYFAEDVGTLFVAKSDSMVYQDRVNDFDSGGFSGGVQIQNAIPFKLQTAQMDQSEVQADYAKRNKLYNEMTLDFDSGGQNVVVSLLFNGGASVVGGTTMAMGTFSQNGRGQIQMNINSGDGQEALNVGVLITGSVTTAVTFYEVHIRAAVQAEFRKSWDTWWVGYGTDEWHLYKQIFAEYKAADAAGVSVLAFTDGNMAAPAFTFTLPQTSGTHRASKKVRFPTTKCRLIRFIGTSNSNFQMYDDTQIEHKKIGSAKGYERGKISP